MAVGVAFPFWQRCEDARLKRGWTKSRLADEAALPRSTYNELPNTSRAPLPRIVHAYADALGINRVEAEQLAGLRPKGAGQTASVRDAILASEILTESNKRTMLELYDQLAAGNAALMSRGDRSTSTEGGHSDEAPRAI